MYQNEMPAPIRYRMAASGAMQISNLAHECALEPPLLIRVSAECVHTTAAIEAGNMGPQRGVATTAMANELTHSERRRSPRHNVRVPQVGSLERLMQFFPQGSRVRIPVGVSRAFSPEPTATVIEYGTPREVIFRFPLPLEFGERVRLASGEGLLNTEAEILAIQLGQAETLVAARFIGEVPNWIIKA
jgi:hypothetical protein